MQKIPTDEERKLRAMIQARNEAIAAFESKLSGATVNLRLNKQEASRA